MKINEIKGLTFNKFSGSQLISIVDNLNFFSKPKLNSSELYSSVLKFIRPETDKPLVLFVSSGCYQANEAIVLVEQFKKFQRGYEVIVPKRVGSFATIVALGATKIHMTRQAGLSTIDACLGGHGYPSVVNNNTLRYVNPAEIASLREFVHDVLDADVKSMENVNRVIGEFVSSEIQKQAQERYHYLKTEILKIIAGHKNLVSSESFVDFLLLNAGSFDVWLNFSDLRHWGLTVELCSYEQEEKILEVENKLRGL